MRYLSAALFSLGLLTAVPLVLLEEQRVVWAQTATDEREAEAERLLQQCRNDIQSNPEAALQSCQQSAAAHQEIGDQAGQGRSLTNLGVAHDNSGRPQQAIECYQKALPLVQAAGDRDAEMIVLLNFTESYSSLERYKDVLRHAQRRLNIARKTRNQTIQAETLLIVGTAYEKLKNKQQAIDSFKESLRIARKINNKGFAASALTGLGRVYSSTGEIQRGIEYYQQLRMLYKARKLQADEIQVLLSISTSFISLNQYQQAIDTLQQALEVVEVADLKLESADAQDLKGLLLALKSMVYASWGQYGQSFELAQQALQLTENQTARAFAFTSLSFVYTSLGEYQLARSYAQQNLELTEALELGELSDISEFKAFPLAALGLAHLGLGQSQPEYLQQSLDNFQQALEISQSTYEQNLKRLALIGLSMVYAERQQFQLAIETAQQGITLSREANDSTSDASFTLALSYAYEKAGQPAAAISAAQSALAFAEATGNQDFKSFSLAIIGKALAAQNEPELAIVFLKEAVRASEEVRATLRELPQSLQTAFINVKDRADTYRELADLLFQQDRVLEAQQVLDLLKVQETADYLRNVRGNANTAIGIPNEPVEQAITDALNTRLDNLIALSHERTELEQVPVDQRTAEQTARLIELGKQTTQLIETFRSFLASDEVQSRIAALRNDTEGESLELANYTDLQESLRSLQQNAVLLYPFVLEDRLELVLVTPDAAIPIRKTVREVDRVTLNRVIGEYHAALKNPHSDPLPLAQQLYDWLIKPLENELATLKAETIIYAPDGQLRYIPLAALHDGNQWLAQRFRINNITAASLTDLTLLPRRNLQVFAGAFSEGSYEVPRGSNQYFAGLQFAGREVERLAALIPGTTKLLNSAFNPDTVYLMNSYSIVHLATHASFVPTSPNDSFIVFGDGEAATLSDVVNWPIDNVELVVLSACETGLGDQLGDGREILGLGYQVQRAGASAVMASLWLVDDGGTQVLMNAFYEQLKQGKSKAEALRQAQISLLSQSATQATQATRSDVEPTLDGGVAVSPRAGAIPRGYSHPYYWAPFILIGNGL